MNSAASDATPALVSLEEVIRPYRGVTVPMLRAWIRRGRLPAVRAGKGYLVAPADVAALLTPKLRVVPERPRRESETARITRQLAASGIG